MEDMDKKKKDLFEVYSSIKKFGRYIGRYKLLIAIMMFMTFLSTVAYIYAPILLSDAINLLHEGILKSEIDIHAIVFIIFKVLIVQLSSMLMMYVEGLIVVYFMNRVMFNIRSDISKKLHKLPLSYFDKVKRGDVLSLLTNDADTVYQNIVYNMGNMTSNIYIIVGMMILFPMINLQLAIIAWAGIFINLFFVKYISSKSRVYFRANQSMIAKLNARVEEVYGAYKIVSAFDAGEYETTHFSELSSQLAHNTIKANFISSILMPVIKSMANIQYLLIVIYGMFMMLGGQILVGTIQLFLEYVRMLNYPMTMMSQISPMLQQSSAALDRIFDFLDADEEVFENPVYCVASDFGSGDIEFKDVCFGYDENVVIPNFNLKVKHGSKIAIVGKTGAGKTTLVKLLMRFYKLNSGEILLSGKNIEQFEIKDYRGMFGMVLQENWIFDGSVMENIKYGCQEVTDDQVFDICRKIKLDHVINSFPEGYHTMIGMQKENLSAGQKQLINIARIMLKNPKFMILDEATSAVDSVSEQVIQSANDELMKGKTSFVIAHRLSTVKNADTILVMDDGNIIEMGSHEELLASNGHYAQLWNN